MKTKNCTICTKVIRKTYETNLDWERRQFCSVSCRAKSPRSKWVKEKISNSCKERGIGTWMSGKTRAIESTLKQREKMLELVASGKHNFWKGGISVFTRSERANFQSTFEYKQWRKSVFERDDFTCQICDKRGGWLEADHIKSYAKYPTMRLEVENGRTLCRPCHLKTPNFGNKSLLTV